MARRILYAERLFEDDDVAGHYAINLALGKARNRCPDDGWPEGTILILECGGDAFSLDAPEELDALIDALNYVREIWK